jgi:hypothetical protein
MMLTPAPSKRIAARLSPNAHADHHINDSPHTRSPHNTANCLSKDIREFCDGRFTPESRDIRSGRGNELAHFLQVVQSTQGLTVPDIVGRIHLQRVHFDAKFNKKKRQEEEFWRSKRQES